MPSRLLARTPLALSLAVLVTALAPACHGPHRHHAHHDADAERFIAADGSIHERSAMPAGATSQRHGPHGPRGQLTVNHSTAVTAELHATLDAFLAAERARDVDALLAFLAPDFHMFQDGVRVDHDATVAQMRATLPTLQAFRPRFDDVQVIPLTRDWALSSLVFHDELVAADGTELAMWGPSTMLWRRDDGRWRLVFADSDHYPEP